MGPEPERHVFAYFINILTFLKLARWSVPLELKEKEKFALCTHLSKYYRL